MDRIVGDHPIRAAGQETIGGGWLDGCDWKTGVGAYETVDDSCTGVHLRVEDVKSVGVRYTPGKHDQLTDKGRLAGGAVIRVEGDRRRTRSTKYTACGARCEIEGRHVMPDRCGAGTYVRAYLEDVWLSENPGMAVSAVDRIEGRVKFIR